MTDTTRLQARIVEAAMAALAPRGRVSTSSFVDDETTELAVTSRFVKVADDTATCDFVRLSAPYERIDAEIE